MKQTVTTRSYFRTLQILHLALIAGQVIFLLITVGLVTTGGPLASLPEETYQLLQWIAAGFALACAACSRLLFNSRLHAVRNKATLQEKCNGYRTALIIRYALLEAPVLFALVIFLLTANFIPAAVAVLLIAAGIFSQPAPAAMAAHLQLPYEEKMLVEDPAAPLYEENAGAL